MKRIIALLICLVLGAACLNGCTNSNEAFAKKSYSAEAKEVTKVCIDVGTGKLRLCHPLITKSTSIILKTARSITIFLFQITAR